QFAVPADVFVPAYTSDQVTPARAEQLRCRAILEVANGPVADAAEPLLAGRGVVIIPDLVANAGGIIASHLEWRYGATATPLPADAASIHAEVKARMAAAVEIMVAKAHGSGLSLVDAAYALALERLSE
ncbi:MAG: hypothetical protein SFV21_14550, partial [Rhodospirillaceae bacterium]|nr:hypothetical protein [Rhodospirillaceae bacterium]